MNLLTVAKLRRGRAGLNVTRPLVALLCGIPMQFVLTDLPELWDGVPDRPAIGTEAYFASGLMYVAVILFLAVWFAPRVSFATAAVAGWWISGHADSGGTGWLALSVAGVLCLGWTLLVKSRCVVLFG